MAHDVFISHAHKDRTIAEVICQKLESAQLRCWMAERDISVGEDWTVATRNAIGSSRVMVLILSEHANAAPHIEREIAHAFYTKRAILPVRLSKTPPRRDFLFYLGNLHWFDASGTPPDQQLEALAASINDMALSDTASLETSPPRRRIKGPPSISFSDSWLGSLQASHYRSLQILKRVAIAALVLAAGWLLWSLHSQTADRKVASTTGIKAGPLTSGSSVRSPPEEGLERPAARYSRFGLWIAPGATPSVQEESSQTPSDEPFTPPATQTPLPRSEVDQRADAKAEGSRGRDQRNSKYVKNGSTRTNSQGGKSKAKAHNRKVRQARITNFEKRLKRAWNRLWGHD